MSSFFEGVNYHPLMLGITPIFVLLFVLLLYFVCRKDVQARYQKISQLPLKNDVQLKETSNAAEGGHHV